MQVATLLASCGIDRHLILVFFAVSMSVPSPQYDLTKKSDDESAAVNELVMAWHICLCAWAAGM